MAKEIAEKAIARENINSWDWEHAERYCNLYLKRELHEMKKTFVDEARAVSTAIVVTYARPFSRNRDRHNCADPANQRYANSLNSISRSVHDQIIELRNRAFAHSDASFHNVKIEATANGGVSTLAHDPLVPLEKSDVEALLANIQTFKRINEELRGDANAQLLSPT